MYCFQLSHEKQDMVRQHEQMMMTLRQHRQTILAVSPGVRLPAEPVYAPPAPPQPAPVLTTYHHQQHTQPTRRQHRQGKNHCSIFHSLVFQ